MQERKTIQNLINYFCPNNGEPLIWLDFKIIFMTVVKVLKGEGISQPGHATMEEYK